MNAEVETKKNGKPTAAKKPAKETKAKPTGKKEQPTAIAITDKPETIWALTRKWFEDGKDEKAVRAAATEWLIKNTRPEDALSFYATRIGYRAVRRAKAGLKAAGKKPSK